MYSRRWHWFIARVATALVLSIALGTASSFAQTAETPDPRQPHDPSELAPVPSTWKGAFTDSLRLLLLEHTTRVAFQDKTRRELAGPFLSNYFRSIRMPKTWEDGDSWRVNYVGHP